MLSNVGLPVITTSNNIGTCKHRVTIFVAPENVKREISIANDIAKYTEKT